MLLIRPNPPAESAKSEGRSGPTSISGEVSSMRLTLRWLSCAVLVVGLLSVLTAQASKAHAGGSPYGPGWWSYPYDPMGDNNPYNYYDGRGYYAPYAYGASQGERIFPYYGPGYYGARADSPYRPVYFTPDVYAPYLYGHLGCGCDYHCGVGWW